MEKDKIDVIEDEELFVWKAKMISTSTKKTIKVHDLLQLIEDDSKSPSSPKFQLAGVDFSIDVLPDGAAYGVPGFIGVFLHNYSKEDQMVSVTVKEASGVESNWWEMEELEADTWWGFPSFLAHKRYRRFAKYNGDVLRLEVSLTLHTKAMGDGWTRYVLRYHPAFHSIYIKKYLED